MQRQRDDQEEEHGQRRHRPLGDRQRVERHVRFVRRLQHPALSMGCVTSIPMKPATEGDGSKGVSAAPHSYAAGRAGHKTKKNLDDAFAEDSIRTDHQRDDHEDVGREVFRAPAHVRIDVPGRHVLDDADDQAADDRPGNRVEPAENDHREHLEAHEREVDVDAEHVAPENASERGDDPGHGPRQPEIPLDVDAHGHRDLLIVGHGAHRDPLPRFQEEPAEAGEERQAHSGPDQLDRRNEQRAQDERLVPERQRQRPRALENDVRSDAAQNRREADGGHDDRNDGPADELAQHDTLQEEAERDHADERGRYRNPERRPQDGQPPDHHEARDHHELALGEVHGVGRLVDEHEPEGDQRVHEPDEHAVGQQEQRELPLKHGRRLPSRLRSGCATGWTRCARLRR